MEGKRASGQLIRSVRPLPRDVRDPLTASEALLNHLRHILEKRGQHQPIIPAHSSEFIEGMWKACQKLPGFVTAELQYQGVEQRTLKKVPIRRANVVWCGDDRFEFEAKGRSPWIYDGEQALVILVHDAFGRAVDIAAWDPETNRLGTWLGVAYALGQGSVFRARLSEGLLVHRTVMNYLRAGGNGIVLLDRRGARNYLADAGPLIAEDQQHRRELTVALTHSLPRILLTSAATKEG